MLDLVVPDKVTALGTDLPFEVSPTTGIGCSFRFVLVGHFSPSRLRWVACPAPIGAVIRPGNVIRRIEAGRTFSPFGERVSPLPPPNRTCAAKRIRLSTTVYTLAL